MEDRLLSHQWKRDKLNEKTPTMRELAEKMGVIHSWIGKVGLGERRLGVIEYIHYCKVLKVDPIEGLHLIL